MRKIDHHHCSGVPCDICGPDPRDAEIARLKAEMEQLRRWGKERNDELCAEIAKRDRALAAGPAALRAKAPRLTWPWSAPGSAYESAAVEVEAAQDSAMKEGT